MGRLPSFSFVLFLVSLLTSMDMGECQHGDCPTITCSPGGPEVRFPFRIKDRQPQHCGYPGFEVACKANNTVLHLPSSSVGETFFIRSISYREQRLSIFDPNNCDAALFFYLNLSSSPFHYDYSSTYNFTFFDCSIENDTDLLYQQKIPCMSSLGNYIIVDYSYSYLDGMPSSCKSMKTVAVPWRYYYSLTSGGGSDICLDWDLPGCKECELGRGKCGFGNITTPEFACYDKPLHSKGASIGSFLLIVATMISIKMYLSWMLDRKKEKENQLKIEKFLENYKSMSPTRYSFADIKRMTNQFKCKLGQGAYGGVFKGNLPTGIPVAVKILKNLGGNGEEFINEVGTIGRIHHINVVRLLGFCSERFKRALIYEFMPNESLEKFIFSKNAEKASLGWEKLQDIAIGIARGIEYLHQGWDQRILHFDIKPHNILLDDNFNPKISDFGLAKLCTKGQSIVSMTAARGTMGYIAPEVFSRNFGNVSYKSDVYSFGMLLLEMVSGRKNIDVTVENASQVYFPEWIYNRLNQGEDMGLKIIVEEDAQIAKKLTIVATWCIQWIPVDRPSIKSVINMLEGSMESLAMPPNPFASTAPPNAITTTHEKQHESKLTVISELE